MRKYICMTFTDNREVFRWEHRDAEGALHSQGMIHLSDNSLGYFLCRALEIDVELVAAFADS